MSQELQPTPPNTDVLLLLSAEEVFYLLLFSACLKETETTTTATTLFVYTKLKMERIQAVYNNHWEQ